MLIVHISSEGYPFSKTGGLADVVGALPLAQSAAGADEVHVILPYYDRFVSEPIARLPELVDEKITFSVELGDLGSWPVRVYRAELVRNQARVIYHLLQCKPFFNRAGLYQENGLDYPDNLPRFTLFCKAALGMLSCYELRPDIIHCHDWQAALVFALLATNYPLVAPMDKTGLVFTIHNLAYQGLFPAWCWNLLGLPQKLFALDGLEYYGRINMMKAALLYAHTLVAASPAYANEIKTPEMGHGLHGLLQRRSSDLSGILNGIDTDYWNPAADAHLTKSYSLNNPSGKLDCKQSLQKQCGLQVDSKTPLLAYVGRLASQKGIDILIPALDDWFAAGGQFGILGNGEPALADDLMKLAASHPGRMSFNDSFDEPLAHRIEAGADFFVMPSRYEPCGLNQMISMRYGTIPIVRYTGGLADTVIDIELDDKLGNGIVFEQFTIDDLRQALLRAMTLYHDSSSIEKIRRVGMDSDFSWGPPAAQYMSLYDNLLRRLV